MTSNSRHIVVIGGGVAGLTASDALARLGLRVSLIEKTPFLGGHAIQLNCKATQACVKCGACLAEEKLMRVSGHRNIEIYAGTEIASITGDGPYEIQFNTHSPMVHADRCDGCGICLQKCPVPGAILQGRATRVGAYVAIRRELCRFFDNGACSLCRDVCPKKAIDLFTHSPVTHSPVTHSPVTHSPVTHSPVTHSPETHSRYGELRADAVLVATGFSPYNPSEKPYGYGQFQDVLTSLDAERLMREHMCLKRPSDGQAAQRIAFIQCVGSRDTQLGHRWCSKICCGASLRMARLLQSRNTDAHATFFYIDIQTFGKDFRFFYNEAKERVTLIRAIPGEITRNDQGLLRLVYFDNDDASSKEALFDVVILAAGVLPSADHQRISHVLNWPVQESGFLPAHGSRPHLAAGIFTAGTAVGPMTIAESIGSAEKAVFDIVRYLS